MRNSYISKMSKNRALSNIFPNKTILFFLLFICTFLSSCSLRKAVQFESENKITKQLNPLKSSLNKSTTCYFDTIQDVTLTTSIKSAKKNILQLGGYSYPDQFSQSYCLTNRVITPQLSAALFEASVPKYILYQKLKVDC